MGLGHRVWSCGVGLYWGTGCSVCHWAGPLVSRAGNRVLEEMVGAAFSPQKVRLPSLPLPCQPSSPTLPNSTKLLPKPALCVLSCRAAGAASVPCTRRGRGGVRGTRAGQCWFVRAVLPFGALVCMASVHGLVKDPCTLKWAPTVSSWSHRS